MTNDFIDKVNRKFPSLSQTDILLNNVVSEIFNYWNTIQLEINESNKNVSSFTKYDNSATSWTQFHLEQNYLRAAREGNQVVITFASFQNVEDDQVVGNIFIENNIPIFDKNNSEFKTDMLNDSLDLLLN